MGTVVMAGRCAHCGGLLKSGAAVRRCNCGVELHDHPVCIERHSRGGCAGEPVEAQTLAELLGGGDGRQ